MRRAALALLVAWTALGCASREPAEAPARPALGEPIRVLLLGDSISIGYTEEVRRLLGERAVVLRAVKPDGKTENCAGTNHGVEHIERWLAIDGGGWDVIHFNFGLHDLKRVDAVTEKNSNDPDDPQQAAPERYAAQLREIVAALDATGARLVFATTTPVPDGGVRPYRAPADPPAYNRIALRVMDEFDVAVNDLHAFALPLLAELQQPVNVHFTKAGSAALAHQVAAVILDVAGLPRD